MDRQLSFATLDYAGKKKRTKRDVFLAEMAAAVPWSVLADLCADFEAGGAAAIEKARTTDPVGYLRLVCRSCPGILATPFQT